MTQNKAITLPHHPRRPRWGLRRLAAARTRFGARAVGTRRRLAARGDAHRNKFSFVRISHARHDDDAHLHDERATREPRLVALDARRAKSARARDRSQGDRERGRGRREDRRGVHRVRVVVGQVPVQLQGRGRHQRENQGVRRERGVG